MKLIPMWAQAAIVAVIVAVIFGAGWKTASWKASGEIESLTGERDAAVLERDEKRAFAEGCRKDIAAIQLTVAKMVTDTLIREKEYLEAVSKPPEIVVRYRDRWHDAPDVIVSENCPEAVGQLFEYLHSLPEIGGPP